MADQLPDILFGAGADGGAEAAPGPPPLDADGISPAALTAASLLDDKHHLTWSRIATPGCEVPPRRSGAASVVVKGKLYMFGVSLCLISNVFDGCLLFHVLLPCTILCEKMLIQYTYTFCCNATSLFLYNYSYTIIQMQMHAHG